jgi:uncharacterized protein (TIGR02246 family)
MRVIVIMAVGVMLVSGVERSTAQTPAAAAASVTADDSAAIKTVVQKYVDAREQGNVEAVTALFTPEADQLVSSGEWRRGREALVSGAMASTQRSGGKRTIAIETIRLVAPGVALADGRYEIAASPGVAARQMWTAFVLTRDAGAWRITAIRNMLPAPPPPPATGGR